MDIIGAFLSRIAVDILIVGLITIIAASLAINFWRFKKEGLGRVLSETRDQLTNSTDKPIMLPAWFLLAAIIGGVVNLFADELLDSPYVVRYMPDVRISECENLMLCRIEEEDQLKVKEVKKLRDRLTDSHIRTITQHVRNFPHTDFDADEAEHPPMA